MTLGCPWPISWQGQFWFIRHLNGKSWKNQLSVAFILLDIEMKWTASHMNARGQGHLRAVSAWTTDMVIFHKYYFKHRLCNLFRPSIRRALTGSMVLWSISYLWLPLIFNFAFLTMHRLYVLFRPDYLIIWFGFKQKNTHFLICKRINNLALLKENKKVNWPEKRKKIWFIEKEKLPFYLTSFHSVGFLGALMDAYACIIFSQLQYQTLP